MNWLPRLGVCVVAVVCSACAAQAPRTARPTPAVVLPAEPFNAADLKLWTLLAAARPAVTIRGIIRNQLMAPHGEWGMIALVDRAEHLRLDLFDPLVGTIGTLRCDSATCEWYLPLARQLYRLPADQAHLERLVRVPLRPADLALLLRGLPPLLADGRLWSMTYQGTVWTAPASAEQVHLDAQSRPIWYERGASGRQAVHIDFAEYRQLGTMPMPYRVQLSRRAGRGALTLEFSEVTVGPIAPARFALDLPPDVETITVP